MLSHDYAESIFNLAELEKALPEIEGIREEGEQEFEDFEYSKGQYEYPIMEIASGAAGIYMVDEIADFFGMDLEDEIEEAPANIQTAFDKGKIKKWADYEFAWEAIDEVADEILEDLNNDDLFKDRCGQFAFTNLEGDGSYWLTWIFDDSCFYEGDTGEGDEDFEEVEELFGPDI